MSQTALPLVGNTGGSFGYQKLCWLDRYWHTIYDCGSGVVEKYAAEIGSSQLSLPLVVYLSNFCLRGSHELCIWVLDLLGLLWVLLSVLSLWWMAQPARQTLQLQKPLEFK